MFAYPYLILLFGLLIRPSLQFELGAKSFPDCDKKKWFCIVNDQCHMGMTKNEFRIVDSTMSAQNYGDASKLKTDCLFLVRIRRITEKKHIVIIKFRGNFKHIYLSIVGEQSPPNTIPVFVCNVNSVVDNNSNLVDIVGMNSNEPKIEFFEQVSIEYKEEDAFVCAGYLNGEYTMDFAKHFQISTVLTEGGASVDYKPHEADTAIKLDEYLGCDQYANNPKIKPKYAGVLSWKGVWFPPNDTLTDCGIEKDEYGLFFKKYRDLPVMPVTRVHCDETNLKYKVELENGDTEDLVDSFVLLCGEHVNTECDKPVLLPCVNCSDTPIEVVKGTGIKPSQLKCPGDSFTVKALDNELQVVGIPTCQGMKSNPNKPIWSFKSTEGNKYTYTFTEAACYPELSCFGTSPLPLTSDCKGEKGNCDTALVTHRGAICPKGMTVKYMNDEDKWITTNASEITCNLADMKWIPNMDNVKNLGCYIDKSNEKGNERDAERKEGKKKKELVRYIVFGVVILLLVLIGIGLIIYLVCMLKRKSPVSARTTAQLGQESTALFSDSKKTEKPTEGLAFRMMEHPGIDVNLLRRKYEDAELTFDSLATVRVDYLCTQLIEEFPDYSIYERTNYAERLVDDLGERANPNRFLQLFVFLIEKEDQFSVWDAMVTGIKCIAMALKVRKRKYLAKRFNGLMYQVGKTFVEKHTFHQKKEEDMNVCQLRSLAFSTLLNAKCPEALEIVSLLYYTTGTKIPAALRRIVWTAMVRVEKLYDEIKKLLDEEMTNPLANDDIRYGTRREHLIYALCSTTNREYAEPLLNTLIRDPQYTTKEIVSGFAAMVRDYDECQDAAKFLFTERHKLIKERMPVTTDEYKKIFRMFYQFAFVCPSSKDWLLKFIAADDTYEPHERRTMQTEMALAGVYGELYAKLHKRCFHVKRGIDLKRELKEFEERYQYPPP